MGFKGRIINTPSPLSLSEWNNSLGEEGITYFTSLASYERGKNPNCWADLGGIHLVITQKIALF